MTPMKVHEAAEALQNEKHKYLRKRGWQYTCDNPASTWLWQKPLPDGRIVVVDTDTAVGMQARADSISLNFWPKQEKEAA